MAAAVALAVESLGHFRSAYNTAWLKGSAAKLGLPHAPAEQVKPLND